MEQLISNVVSSFFNAAMNAEVIMLAKKILANVGNLDGSQCNFNVRKLMSEVKRDNA